MGKALSSLFYFKEVEPNEGEIIVDGKTTYSNDSKC